MRPSARAAIASAHFDDIRERVVVTTSEKKEAVRALIDEGRIETVFQPIWDFAEETLLGVEALMRPDPSYGLSGSAEAFDVAEQIGRVHQLDVLCVENALRVVAELDRRRAAVHQPLAPDARPRRRAKRLGAPGGEGGRAARRSGS